MILNSFAFAIYKKPSKYSCRCAGIFLQVACSSHFTELEDTADIFGSQIAYRVLQKQLGDILDVSDRDLFQPDSRTTSQPVIRQESALSAERVRNSFQTDLPHHLSLVISTERPTCGFLHWQTTENRRCRPSIDASRAIFPHNSHCELRCW